jgi:hypothetical protein
MGGEMYPIEAAAKKEWKLAGVLVMIKIFVMSTPPGL